MTTKSRNRYSEAFKTDALALAEKIGASPAAKQLGLHDGEWGLIGGYL